MVVTVISLIFIFIGRVNTLGPIVTMPFMLTYAAVDYAYFSLAMSFDKRKAREARFKEAGDAHDLPPTFDKTALNGDLSKTQAATGATGYGAIRKKTKDSDDLDNLFPERNHERTHLPKKTQPEMDLKSETTSMASEPDDTAGLLGNKEGESELLFIC